MMIIASNNRLLIALFRLKQKPVTVYRTGLFNDRCLHQHLPLLKVPVYTIQLTPTLIVRGQLKLDLKSLGKTRYLMIT